MPTMLKTAASAADIKMVASSITHIANDFCGTSD
jgi:hypothetical protein